MAVKLNREMILAAQNKLSTKVIPVPEWGEGAEVTIKELMANEAMALASHANLEENKSESAVLWAIAGIVDEDGNRMFTEADKEQFGKMGAAVILRVSNAMVDLCGFGDDKTKQTEKN